MENNLGRKTESEILPALTFQPDSNHITQLEQNENLKCIKCSNSFEFPSKKDDYLAHLFLEHRLVIADVEEIALLGDYLKFWEKEFFGQEFEEYCTTMLLDQLPDGTFSKNEKYYLLSDILPKDYELRTTLQKQRLERALARHQYELTDRNFKKECLYCRDVIEGLRADFLEHLFSKHFLLLGRPEKLVYVDELLAKIENNMKNLICLFCEKVFKDRATLKEHMRKKTHKKINPNNKDYDKFFLIHYRHEQPKKNRDYRSQQKRNTKIKCKETPSTIQPTTSVSMRRARNASENGNSVEFVKRFVNSDDSDSDWSDWDGENTNPLHCLFCTTQQNTPELLKSHILDEHDVHMDREMKDLNFYQKIKIINYVRRQICLIRCVSCNLRCETQELLLKHMSEMKHFSLGTKKQWDKPEYFFPTYEDDALLCCLDDTQNDDNTEKLIVPIISEDSTVQINKDAERLSLENFDF